MAAMYNFSTGVALPESCWAFFAASMALSARPVGARGHHGNAPVRHGRVGIEGCRLQEGALRLGRPERVHLGHALIEELLSLRTGSRDREVDFTLPLEKARRQRGCDAPRRRGAQIQFGLLLLRRQSARQ